jgi:hypothetical protein
MDMRGLPDHFEEFISADCDRCSFIQSYLADRDVDSAVIPLDGKKHVYVKFPSQQYNPEFRIKTVIAHYDRAEGSPGANDNSAADFCLMDWAERLLRFPGCHNVRLLLTDGEELGSGGIEQQGAFSLASLFRSLGITKDDVYVFDCMGRGTIPVLGRTDDVAGAPYAFRRRLADLENRTEDLLRASGTGRWLTLPLPYSDNAGFIACGIPAVAVTMLPENDADMYLSALMREKRLEGFVRNHEVPGPASEKDALKMKLSAMLPETWRMFHTRYDSPAGLTPESFALTAKILDALADTRTLS